MATPESKVKAAVVRILDAYGAWYFFPPANGYGRAGIPDIIACYMGQMYAFECKAGSNQATALQKREITRINEAGGLAFVIHEDTVPHVKKLMEHKKEQMKWPQH